MTDAEKAELELYRRHDLLRRMQEVSREHWAGSWKSDLEHDLYLIVFHGASADYGMGVIAPAALAEIKRLAELTQVWWVRSGEAAAQLAIPLAEAERRFSKLIARDEAGVVVQTLSIPEVKQTYEQAGPEQWDFETIAPVLKGMPIWQAYRLRSNAAIALFHREGKGDWELRFGDTTVDFVEPTWAKKPE
jgi:hypothetical protein